MPQVVEQTMSALITIVTPLSVGTNLAMLYFLWMLVSGALLPNRGAIFPALQTTGLEEKAIRRAWQAFRRGGWQIGELILAWEQYMQTQQGWQPYQYEGYYAVVTDPTPFWRPKLKQCRTKYYNSQAEKALPAIVLGLVARIGHVEGRRIALPRKIMRVHPQDPSNTRFKGDLLQYLRYNLTDEEIAVQDAGFKIRECHEAQLPRYVLRLPKNFTARRNWLAYKPHKKGQKPTYGPYVRPLARSYKDNTIVATPADAIVTWHNDAGQTIIASCWYNLVRPDVQPGVDVDLFDVVAIKDPAYDKPMLLATNVKLNVETLCALYRDRWPIEQLPLAGKQMVGSHRQFVFAAESCQRLPELVILAGSILTGLAAIHPHMPTGFWDRNPQPTPGRFRRALMGLPFPQSYPLPEKLRQKASVTDHLPKGILAHRRSAQPTSAP